MITPVAERGKMKKKQKTDENNPNSDGMISDVGKE